MLPWSPAPGTICQHINFTSCDRLQWSIFDTPNHCWSLVKKDWQRTREASAWEWPGTRKARIRLYFTQFCAPVDFPAGLQVIYNIRFLVSIFFSHLCNGKNSQPICNRNWYAAYFKIPTTGQCFRRMWMTFGKSHPLASYRDVHMRRNLPRICCRFLLWILSFLGVDFNTYPLRELICVVFTKQIPCGIRWRVTYFCIESAVGTVPKVYSRR